MCGIVGALALPKKGFSVTGPYIDAMRDTMAHRGPDGAETWVSDDGRVGLGHRRLAIIDLACEANQPMSNEDGSIVVVFNGEIYNHAEIRAELEMLGGHTWKTDHSDTEVILHAFEEWGIECVYRFRGMFGIGLWDGRSGELWLVRDRIGIKPVYWSMHDGRLVFASEIKALLADPDQTRELDEEAFFHYLTFMTTPAPMTLFAGIRKLPAATWMHVAADGTTTERRYWDPLAHAADLSGASDDEIATQLLDELRTAVRLRKIADVPVGVFLSGGIDSSTNAALFSEGEGAPVETFTIGYEGDHASYANENEYARLMAEKVGADHHELMLAPDDALSFLPRMVWLQDEPIGDPVCVPVYYVSKLARDNGVVVCQVGEGSDELFWGYPWWGTMLKLQRWNRWPVPRACKRAGLALMAAAGKRESRFYEYLWRGAHGLPVFWGGAFAFTEERKRALLSPRLRERFAHRSSWEAIAPVRERFEAAGGRAAGDLAWMTYLDLNLRLPELLLMRVDKMAMGVSLEARVPFLDHRFVEFAMGIPEAVKTRGGELKTVLKRAVRGLVPDALIDREKQGFGIPLAEWAFGELGDAMHAEIRAFAAETDLLDPAAVDRLLAENDGNQVWYLYNFVAWYKRFIAEKPGADPAPYAAPARELTR